MSHQSVHDVPAEVTRELQFTDKLLYIYTSGTTGLPKAAVVKNSRLEGHNCMIRSERIIALTILHWIYISQIKIPAKYFKH